MKVQCQTLEIQHRRQSINMANGQEPQAGAEEPEVNGEATKALLVDGVRKDPSRAVGLYTALQRRWVHHDSQMWSRTQLLFLLQSAAWAGAYHLKGSWGATFVLVVSVLITSLLWRIVHLDQRNRDETKSLMDKLIQGTALPGDRSGWASGKVLLQFAFGVLILLDGVLAFAFSPCPNGPWLPN